MTRTETAAELEKIADNIYEQLDRAREVLSAFDSDTNFIYGELDHANSTWIKQIEKALGWNNPVIGNDLRNFVNSLRQS